MDSYTVMKTQNGKRRGLAKPVLVKFFYYNYLPSNVMGWPLEIMHVYSNEMQLHIQFFCILGVDEHERLARIDGFSLKVS